MKIEQVVSVLMCTYKEPKEYVSKAVISILNQTYKNIELVVVVDDPTNMDVVNLLEEFKKKDDRVRVLINENNQGLVKSLNRGLRYCKGSLIARMDADDISEITRIEKQIEFIEKNNCDLIGSNYLIFGDENSDKNKMYFPEEHKQCIKMLKKGNCIAHPSWLCKREVYNSLCGYRNIDCCEDYDFVIRAVLNGFIIGNCQEFLLNYRYNLKGISRSNSIKQFLITKLISKEYRKKKVASEEEVSCYLKSEVYEHKRCRIEKTNVLRKEYKEEKSKLAKIFKLVRLVGYYGFWEERIF